MYDNIINATPKPPRTTTIYLRPEERALLVAAAMQRGMGPSRYARLAAVDAARRDLAAPSAAEEERR